MITVGPLIAVGRTSDVYAYRDDSVVKVLRADVSAEWADMEARYTAAVRQLGAPAPDVRDLVEVDGRPAIVFERIDGESLWERMLANPDDTPALARELATIQRHIMSVGLPAGIPAKSDRMAGKIGGAEQLAIADRNEAQQLVHSLPSGAALLHGDLHPGNVLLGPHEPVVIDWFDAAIGHPVTDVVRTSLLIRPRPDRVELPHLPRGSPEVLDRVHRSYVAAMADVLAVGHELLRQSEAVLAASRLAERAEADESSLLQLWAERDSMSRSPLLGALSDASDE